MFKNLFQIINESEIELYFFANPFSGINKNGCRLTAAISLFWKILKGLFIPDYSTNIT